MDNTIYFRAQKTLSFSNHTNPQLIAITFCSFNSQNKSSLISTPRNIVLISFWQFKLQPHTSLNPMYYSVRVWERVTGPLLWQKGFWMTWVILRVTTTPFWNEYHSFSQPRFGQKPHKAQRKQQKPHRFACQQQFMWHPHFPRTDCQWVLIPAHHFPHTGLGYTTWHIDTESSMPSFGLIVPPSLSEFSGAVGLRLIDSPWWVW